MPNWFDADAPNAEVACGAVLSGPYIAAPSNGTDVHTDTRDNFRENEPAIDYSASLFCAMAAYAALPDSALDDCGSIVSRDAFAGRP